MRDSPAMRPRLMSPVVMVIWFSVIIPTSSVSIASGTPVKRARNSVLLWLLVMV